jgi:hypothetical protein
MIPRSRQDWLDLARYFQQLAADCGDKPMRAERRNPDGTVDVIEDVNRASIAMCLRRAADADE